jgi:hypothetical protein
VYFSEAGGTSSDRINVYVKNLNTNVEEIFSIDVTLRRGSKSTMSSVSVDNVSFWGSIY